MRSDIDNLMAEKRIEALLVIGPSSHNPTMAYFTGQAHLTHGFLLKKRDQGAVLFHGSMERDEATDTGLETRNLDDYDYMELVEQAGGDTIQAVAKLLGRMLNDYEVQGKVSLYGKVEIGPQYASLRSLEEATPGIELVGEMDRTSVLTRARATKGPEEIERLRKIGEITVAVVSEVATFLTSHRVENGTLINSHGESLTVGDVKRRINLWLAMRGAENPAGTIFAIGRDAGVPHSSGKDEDLIQVGKPIVFDIYPTEAGGGYFYDFTRTWCLGHAPDEVQKIYDDVRQVYETVYASIKADTPCRDHQILTCKLFQEQGHPTVLETPKTQEGYVHTLAHGVGLAVHEGPYFSHLETNNDMLRPGSVITVEPGLYYPDREIGVRIEDTVWVRPDGELETLVDFPKDLVLEMHGD